MFGRLAILTVGLSVALLAGCNSPERVTDSTIRKRANLPESWVYLSGGSGKVSALPPGLQRQLKDLRADLVTEQQGRYFAFYGHYTPETQGRIDAMNRACNEAYLVSDRAIASNLTPEMGSVSQTGADLWWDDQEIYNIQSRELQDDWRAFWLMDSPSILSRHPIVDTAVP